MSSVDFPEPDGPVTVTKAPSGDREVDVDQRVHGAVGVDVALAHALERHQHLRLPEVGLRLDARGEVGRQERAEQRGADRDEERRRRSSEPTGRTRGP